MASRPTDVAPPAQPRDAATLILLRDAPPGHPEVLLLRRHAGSPFMPSAWVFPGGTVDAGDKALPRDRWSGTDPQRLSELTGRPADVAFGSAVAAVRETFEEAGLLLARSADGGPPDPAVVGSPAPPADGFGDWLRAHHLLLDLSALVPWSRWITPVIRPRRYDTLFFLADAPADQVAVHDPVEMTGARWISPRDALREAELGELTLAYPTVKTLQALAAFDDRAALRAAAVALRRLRVHLPHVVLDDAGRQLRILGPDDPDYPWPSYPELSPIP